MRWFWVACTVVLAFQFAALVGYSTFLFHRFDLTDDFATYSQAWWLIGHGHLNPVDTVQVPNYPFVRSHAELAMWPLALVGRLWPNPVQLLWMQDAALVATEWLAMTWVAARCADRLGRRRTVVAGVALVFLVVNPWWYLTASFDVHFETLGLPFVVGTAYALWCGRPRTALVLALVALLFGDVVAVSVLAVGVAGLLSRRVRRGTGWRWPALVAAAAALFLVVIAVAGADRGSGVVVNYGYLVGAGPTASSTQIVVRLLLHPWHALRVLVGRWPAMLRVLASAGLVGVVTPWGLVLSLGILAPAALNANPAFLTPAIAFQSLGVIPFVFVGTVLVLVRIGTGPHDRRPTRPEATASGRRGRSVAVVLAAVLGAVSLVSSAGLYGTVATGWWRVDAPAASVLRDVLPVIPGSAQVIASQGVIGRFAGRVDVYPFVASPQSFPVRSHRVVFVIAPDQGIESVPPAAAEASVASLERLPGTTVLARLHGVTVVEWRPPPGTTAIVLPGPVVG